MDSLLGVYWRGRGDFQGVCGHWSEAGRHSLASDVDWSQAQQVPPKGGALNLLYVEALRSTSDEFRGSLSSGVTSPTRGATEGD